jgi:hypothetical protein
MSTPSAITFCLSFQNKWQAPGLMPRLVPTALKEGTATVLKEGVNNALNTKPKDLAKFQRSQLEQGKQQKKQQKNVYVFKNQLLEEDDTLVSSA